jgi:hypothetical protein
MYLSTHICGHHYLIEVHNQALSSSITCHRVCDKSNKTGATCGTGTAYPSRAPEFTSVFSSSCCSVVSFLCNVWWIVACPVVLVLVAIVLSVLPLAASDYPPLISSIFSCSHHDIHIAEKLLTCHLITFTHTHVLPTSYLHFLLQMEVVWTKIYTKIIDRNRYN